MAKISLRELRRGARKQHTGDLVMIWTSLWTDEDPELLESILNTEGEDDSARVRNWMRNAFKVMSEREKKIEEIHDSVSSGERTLNPQQPDWGRDEI